MVKILYQNRYIDLDDMSAAMTKEELIELISLFGFPGWGSPGYFRCIECGLIEKDLDEWDYFHSHIEIPEHKIH